jgi:exosome complex component RRP41
LAGIPLKDLAVSCTAGHIHGKYIVDMNHFEETSNCPRVFLAFQPSIDTIISVQTFSRQSHKDFEELLSTAMTGCAEVYGQMQKALRGRLKQLAAGAGKIEV